MVNNQEIPLHLVGTQVADMLKNRSNKMIYIHADRFVEYGAVASALAELKRSGLGEISLVTTYD